MSNVVRTAGVAGTFQYTLSQVPAQIPTLTIYSDAARTVVAVPTAPLVATANPAVFTAAYPATLPAGTYFLSFAIVMTVGQPAFVDNDDTLELRAVSGGVGTVAFATSADLATYLQRPLTAAETATAELLLSLSTAAIRNYTRQVISFVQNDTLTLDPPYGREVFLPELPVTDIASVTVAGVPLVENVDYFWYPETGIVEVDRGQWGSTRRSVVIVYSHGHDPIPDDVRGVCIAAAGRSIGNPQGAAEQQVNMGPASVRQTFPVSVPRLQTVLTDGEKEILNRYRLMVCA